MPIWIDAGHQVRAGTIVSNRASAVGVGVASNIGDRIPVARGGREKSGKLPVSDDLVPNTRSAAAQPFPAAEGQIVHVAKNETMSDIEIRVAILQVGVGLQTEISVISRAKA